LLLRKSRILPTVHISHLHWILKVEKSIVFLGKELPSSSVTDDFNEKIKETKSMLLHHKQLCSKKIDSLKMFLETEHEQAKHEIEKKKLKQQKEIKQKLEDERNAALFGNTSKLRIEVFCIPLIIKIFEVKSIRGRP